MTVGSLGSSGVAEHLPLSEIRLLIGEQVSFGAKPWVSTGCGLSPPRQV